MSQCGIGPALQQVTYHVSVNVLGGQAGLSTQVRNGPWPAIPGQPCSERTPVMETPCPAALSEATQ